MGGVDVAVIPAAGFGTRVLPASKVISKELFPIYDRPAIHIIVSECVRAGIKEIILVISKRKMDILRYFEKDEELEKFLSEKGKTHLLKPLGEFRDVKIDYAIQDEQKGLGHAVACAKQKVGERNFAVLLPDDIFITTDGSPAISHLVDVFLQEKPSVGVFLAKRVPKNQISKYGVPKVLKKKRNVIFVEGFVEKPSPEKAPSDFAVVGRYVFTPEIFRWIESEKPDERGEIQLAGAMGRASYKSKSHSEHREIGKKEKHESDERWSMLGVVLRGRWLDIGSPDGFARAVCFFAKKKDLLG